MWLINLAEETGGLPGNVHSPPEIEVEHLLCRIVRGSFDLCQYAVTSIVEDDANVAEFFLGVLEGGGDSAFIRDVELEDV